jgi:PAS domain S-box-containing protein
MGNYLRWLNGLDPTPGTPRDLRWAWVTIALIALVAIGYGVIAFNWYFQAKLKQPAESRKALARLRWIVLWCCVCGYVFYATDITWSLWRLYDLALLLLAVHTWTFAVRMRGIGLVTERLEHLAEMERAAARYREMAELLPDMVWTAAADGRVDFCNRRWLEYAGDAGPANWLDALHPDDRPAVVDWWRKAVADREPVSREVRLRAAGGQYRTFVLRATPVRHGQHVKWLGACADVEDQKRIADEKDSQARQKAFFLNALSHDLRAPLNIVVLNAQLLKMSARDKAESDSAQTIMENALAAGDLVARLLDHAKAGDEDRNVIDVVPLSALLQQVLRRFLPITEAKSVRLTVTGDEDVEVLSDRQKLDRVISNLVDNAIKYTDRGDVTIDLAARDGSVLIGITDTGVGVPPENVPHLFDVFYQADNQGDDRPKGFGMGLAICRTLMRQLGGDVRLARTGPEGSRFELTLPGVSPATAESPAPQPAAETTPAAH